MHNVPEAYRWRQDCKQRKTSVLHIFADMYYKMHQITATTQLPKCCQYYIDHFSPLALLRGCQKP